MTLIDDSDNSDDSDSSDGSDESDESQDSEDQNNLDIPRFYYLVVLNPGVFFLPKYALL